MKTFNMVTLVVLLSTGSALARQAEPLNAMTEMPIKEVTVFKDGHAFILHHGKMPVNTTGKVVMDYLPAPVLGTYWPYAADENAELRAVVAGRRKVLVDKTALTIREMIKANVGANVVVTECTGLPYEATILAIPSRSGEELEALHLSASEEHLPEEGSIVMFQTVNGAKAVKFDRILDVTFVSERRTMTSSEEFRNTLTLDLKWKDRPRSEAEVGMIYLQKGIRWIPGYKIDINDRGKAVIKLAATLINELADVRDVTAHLVIGVPSFAFKDSVDPMSLRQDVARLSSNFRNNSRTAFGFSNSIMTQRLMPSVDARQRQPESGTTMNLGPELGGSGKSEDLYMFTIEHISLRKGERMVLPIAEYDLSYTDVYKLDIPFSPPMDIYKNLSHTQRREIMQMQAGPKVKHKIRIENSSGHPFTTAPAMILKNGRIIAQGMMTYTPAGADVDIELTTAVDIGVKKVDNETERTPNAVNWNGYKYFRIDLEGKITLTNYKNEKVVVEVVRHVLGNLDVAGEEGDTEMVNPFEDNSFLPDQHTTSWWYGYSWPWWWYRFNGVGRIKWTTTLEPNQSADHTYSWHYFWR